MSNLEKLEVALQSIRTLLQIIIGVYIVFCVLMWCYYMVTLHEVPNDCSFFSLSAHIGFIMLVVILMLVMICT